MDWKLILSFIMMIIGFFQDLLDKGDLEGAKGMLRASKTAIAGWKLSDDSLIHSDTWTSKLAEYKVAKSTAERTEIWDTMSAYEKQMCVLLPELRPIGSR